MTGEGTRRADCRHRAGTGRNGLLSSITRPVTRAVVRAVTLPVTRAVTLSVTLSVIRAVTLIVTAALLAGCAGDVSEWAKGELQISFTLTAEEGFDPSRQTVVWLENADGEYVRPLLVSLWMAVAGYDTDDVCPTWTSSAAWSAVSPELFDAVTGATPPWGSGTVRIDCEADTLRPGTWHYCVETHLQEDRNILYRGRIQVGTSGAGSTAERVAGPESGEPGAGILSAVTARYLPPE